MESPDPAETLLRDFGLRLSELRRRKNLTQEALASNLDVSLKYVQRLERGLENVTLRTISKVSEVLGAAPLSFFVPPSQVGARRPGRPRLAATKEEPLHATGPRIGARSVVSLLTLTARAGFVGEAELVEISEWLDLGERKKDLSRGHFAARVRGDSMEPFVPEGAIVLFRAPVQEPHGKLVLVEWTAEENLRSYSLKRASIVMDRAREGTSLKVKLSSTNPKHPPREVELTEDGPVRIVAEFVEILSDPRNS